MNYNGIQWPAECFDSAATHFFAIGDWGGVCNWADNKCATGADPKPMPNRPPGVPLMLPIDVEAQTMVAKRMREKAIALRSDGNEPKFIINVGDNFYPGGVDSHCGDGSPPQGAFEKSQFAQIFEDMYPVEDLGNIEWWSVLGNHDYGGVCYIKGWDQQIWYTWKPDGRWLMPAQYWSRRVQFKTFSADFFFLDNNLLDTGPGVDPKHNICSKENNPGPYCGPKYPAKEGTDPGSCPVTGPTGPADACDQWFRDNWKIQYKWFMAAIAASDADWQIVVTHYPARFNPGMAQDNTFLLWPEVAREYGIDLIVAGHEHDQKIVYREVEGGVDLGDTAWVITGGGGGVTSEIFPTASGQDDAYGFMDMKISLETIEIASISHGGLGGTYIERQKATVYPRERGTAERQRAEILEVI